MGHKDEDVEEKEEDKRREAAIAAAPSLQPSFKPKHVTQDQLSKLQVWFTTPPIYTHTLVNLNIHLMIKEPICSDF